LIRNRQLYFFNQNGCKFFRSHVRWHLIHNTCLTYRVTIYD
jgi:hypothetical protein